MEPHLELQPGCLYALCCLCAIPLPCAVRSLLRAHGFPGAVRLSMLRRNNVLEVVHDMRRALVWALGTGHGEKADHLV